MPLGVCMSAGGVLSQADAGQRTVVVLLHKHHGTLGFNIVGGQSVRTFFLECLASRFGERLVSDTAALNAERLRDWLVTSQCSMLRDLEIG